MRTTVTLDPDVERMIKDAVRRTGTSFKAVLNQAIREGLSGRASAGPMEPFVLHAQPMGLRAGIDASSLNRLADDLDVDAFIDAERGRR